MILQPGNKLLIVHRRLFKSDRTRLYLGTVNAYEDGIASVTGYTFVHDDVDGDYLRKNDERTKIVPIASGSLIVYLLSSEFAIDEARICTRENRLILSDGRGSEMNLSEHAH